MRIAWIIIVLSVLSISCNREKIRKSRVEAIEEKYGQSSYETGLAYVSYIMKGGSDLDYSLELIEKLMSYGAYSEAWYALDKLEEEYQDYRIFYLEAVCYRNQEQFSQAKISLKKAMELSDSPVLREESEKLESAYHFWQELSSLNQIIKRKGLSDSLRLERAKLLIHSGMLEAAFFDLDSVIKKDEPVLKNEAYMLKTIAFIGKEQYTLADSIADIWVQESEGKSYETAQMYAESLDRIIAIQSRLSSGNPQPEDYINLARSLKDIAGFSKAEGTLDQGLAKFPDNLKLYYAKLLLYVESGRYREARELSSVIEEGGIEIPYRLKEIFE